MTLKPLLDKTTPYLSNQESSTVTNLMIVVMAMLDKRTVCINKLKSAVGGIIDKPDTKVQSHYTRLIRFSGITAPVTFGFTSFAAVYNSSGLIPDTSLWTAAAGRLVEFGSTTSPCA